METPKLNQSKLTPEQRDKLEKWQQNKQIINNLEEMAAMSHEMIQTLSDTNKNTSEYNQRAGALLMDMRDSLIALKEKESPESPDHATPIVDRLEKLEKTLDKAIKGLKLDPKIEVASPNVSVEAPNVVVDTKDISKELAKIPKEFDKAVAKIKLEIPEQPDRWDEVLEQLESIDTATRMKPQPGTMGIKGVTITNGAIPSSDVPLATRLDDSASPILYIGKAPVGSATSSAVWQIAKLNTTSGLVKTWADGNSNFDNVWDDILTITYS